MAPQAAKINFLLSHLGLSLSTATTNCDQFALLLPNVPTKKGSEKLYNLTDHGFRFTKKGQALSLYVDLTNTSKKSDMFMIEGLTVTNNALASTSKEDGDFASRHTVSVAAFIDILQKYKSSKFDTGRNLPAGVTQFGVEPLFVNELEKHCVVFQLPNPITPAVAGVKSFDISWYAHKGDKVGSNLFFDQGGFEANEVLTMFTDAACEVRKTGKASEMINKIGFDPSLLIQTEAYGRTGIWAGPENKEIVKATLSPYISKVLAAFDAGQTMAAIQPQTTTAPQTNQAPVGAGLSFDKLDF